MTEDEIREAIKRSIEHKEAVERVREAMSRSVTKRAERNIKLALTHFGAFYLGYLICLALVWYEQRMHKKGNMGV